MQFIAHVHCNIQYLKHFNFLSSKYIYLPQFYEMDPLLKC